MSREKHAIAGGAEFAEHLRDGFESVDEEEIEEAIGGALKPVDVPAQDVIGRADEEDSDDE